MSSWCFEILKVYCFWYLFRIQNGNMKIKNKALHTNYKQYELIRKTKPHSQHHGLQISRTPSNVLFAMSRWCFQILKIVIFSVKSRINNTRCNKENRAFLEIIDHISKGNCVIKKSKQVTYFPILIFIWYEKKKT